MSLIEQLQKRKQDEADARELSNLKAEQQKNTLVNMGRDEGANAALKAVENRLAQITAAQNAYGLDSQWTKTVDSLTNKPDSYPLTMSDIEMVAKNRNPADLEYEFNKLVKDGKQLEFDDIAFMSRDPNKTSDTNIRPDVDYYNNAPASREDLIRALKKGFATNDQSIREQKNGIDKMLFEENNKEEFNKMRQRGQ